MKVKTSRYNNRGIANTDLVPVAISRGLPRFPLSFKVAAKVEAITPYGWMLDDSVKKADYEVAYREKLDKVGYPAIRAELERISREHDGRDLVLLCWEDIRKPDCWCHRTMFAEWWTEHSGEAVEELETGEWTKVGSQLNLF